MPQMAPLYWEILFIMFIISMIMMMIIIFHSKFNQITVNTNMKPLVNQVNWKW
uniref:ATP synthase F0 subunit 8 n=1 Tax=Lamprocoris roylii TaxID=2080375 RepID=A0A2P1CLT3_9HEMI|nr:ATP synthase F0 subunit 8 [Lamprocoris roylii]